MSNKILKTVKYIYKMTKPNFNQDQSDRADSAIKNHVIWSMGAGLIPIPIADFFAVAAVQVDMIRTISSVYGIDFKESEGKAIISALTSSGLSRLGANTLIKLIPGIGSLLGGLSMSIVSGASTYAVGQVFKRHFETGGTILDLDSERFQRFYEEQFEKGKKVAEDIKQEKDEKGHAEESTADVETAQAQTNSSNQSDAAPLNNSEIISKLKELAELKEMGVLNEEEFMKMKTQLIKNYN
jgi:uncharacterized protein (DUF697 family)